MRRGAGKRQPNAKDRAAEFVRQDRRAEVFRLTVDGKSLREIGAELGISHEQARTDLRLVTEDRNAETKEQARAIAKERLETIIAAQMPAVRAGAIDASYLVIAATATDAKLRGWEAPKQLEVSGAAALAINVTARVAEAFDAPAAAEEPKLPPHVNGAGTH